MLCLSVATIFYFKKNTGLCQSVCVKNLDIHYWGGYGFWMIMDKIQLNDVLALHVWYYVWRTFKSSYISVFFHHLNMIFVIGTVYQRFHMHERLQNKKSIYLSDKWHPHSHDNRCAHQTSEKMCMKTWKGVERWSWGKRGIEGDPCPLLISQVDFLNTAHRL